MHHFFIADYSSGRMMQRWERAFFRAGADNPTVARAIDEVASRRRSPLRMLDPRLAPHLIRGIIRNTMAT